MKPLLAFLLCVTSASLAQAQPSRFSREKYLENADTLAHPTIVIAPQCVSGVLGESTNAVVEDLAPKKNERHRVLFFGRRHRLFPGQIRRKKVKIGEARMDMVLYFEA